LQREIKIEIEIGQGNWSGIVESDGLAAAGSRAILNLHLATCILHLAGMKKAARVGGFFLASSTKGGI